MSARNLVIGASGFLGSHVTRTLAARGEPVRALVRATSSRRALADLDAEIVVGDIDDPDSLRAAMRDIDTVYYCVVDARPWLRDPAPLFRTNVTGLRTVLDVAVAAGLRRFVFTSSIATLPIGADLVDEESGAHNWLRRGGAYVRSRVAAEDLVLEYARERGLPAVAMCVANTYGSGDFLPTPHGGFVAAAARGKMPFYIGGVGAEVVGIRDAAEALILAGERGEVGQRYIVSAGFRRTRELLDFAASVTGAPPPRYGVPRAALPVAGAIGELVARLTRKDVRVTRTTMRLMHIMTPLDNAKAVRELGWTPRPIEDAITEAAIFFTSRRRRAESPAGDT
ncbi:NAD-dependent epimerase/dehydratase family protein [Nocardia bovistercoris]|uniref:NAD-dependent epimerase/dehydratase family protein n=1 Tax=Nocardia bovistercoris TaxID=2785916 RepID=A0A931IDM9_9NOCA|nr:NAD-dependent epimerase/dehydratase family protein [Nocardia bovistercoris]MBH0777858.1 NAD-dependent epimerase/dehydratase family protein [Nocardia bovistercoris]